MISMLWQAHRPRRSCWALVVALALCTFGASAQAERALLVPASGTPQQKAARDAADSSVAAWLKQLGVEIVQAREAARRDPRGRTCTTASCAAELLPVLDLDFAVATAIWTHSEAGGPEHSSVYVTLIDREGSLYPGEAVIEQSVERATQAALLDAQGLRLLGPGPWIEVDGTPKSATLQIDGRLVGSLPYRGSITAGAHTLALDAPGYQATTRQVEVSLSAAGVQRIDVALPIATPQSASAAVSAESNARRSVPADSLEPDTGGEPPLRAPSPWNYVIGSALLAGAVALAIEPVREIALHDDCVGTRDEQGRCSERVRFGTRGKLLAAGAAIALVSGVTVLVFRPIRVEVDASAIHVRAHLHARF
jgi:hypothetical protein